MTKYLDDTGLAHFKSKQDTQNAGVYLTQAAGVKYTDEATKAETIAQAATGKFVSPKRLFDYSNWLATESVVAKQIHNLAQAQQGKLQETQTDSTSAYTKTVVAGALDYARLTQWGGKSFVWNQLLWNLVEGGYWLTVGGSTTYSDGVATFTPTRNTDGTGIWFYGYPIQRTNGHKYIYRYDIRCAEGQMVNYWIGGFFDRYINGTGEWLSYEAIKTVTAETGSPYGYCLNKTDGERTAFSVKNVKVIDLTLIESSLGVTISSVSDMDALFPNWRTAPQANAEVMSANLVSIYSKGVNLFNKTAVVSGSYIDSTDGSLVSGSSGKNASPLIPVEPSTAYTITAQATDTTGAWYDASQNFISGVTTYGTQTSPAGARYFRFTILDANLNTAQFEKGSSATAYKAYMEYTKTIPTAVTQLTGYGWSAGTAKNEVVWTESKADYTQNITRGQFSGAIGDTITLTGAKSGTQYLCAKGDIGTVSGTSIVLTQALDNDYIYFELATPVVTDVTDLLGADNTLRVEAGGTLTFNNQLTNMKIPIGSTEEYEVSINDAIFQGGS